MQRGNGQLDGDVGTDSASAHARQLVDRQCHATIIDVEAIAASTAMGPDPVPLQQVAAWAEQYRAIWEARLDRMDGHLTELQSPKDDHDH